MARPKRYKRDETVKKAMDYFWKNGFSGASIRDLGKALDLHPGSIYSSFGSKESLYLEALRLFADQTAALWSESMDGGGEFYPSLETYFRKLVEDRTNPCTCMIAKTISLGAEQNKELVAVGQGLIHDFRQTIASRVELAQEQNEISKSLCSMDFACLIQVQLLGIRTFADTGPTQDELFKTIGQSVRLLRRAGEEV